MCFGDVDPKIMAREIEARVACVKVNEALTETDEKETRGLLAWACGLAAQLFGKVGHV